MKITPAFLQTTLSEIEKMQFINFAYTLIAFSDISRYGYCCTLELGTKPILFFFGVNSKSLICKQYELISFLPSQYILKTQRHEQMS